MTQKSIMADEKWKILFLHEKNQEKHKYLKNWSKAEKGQRETKFEQYM